MTRTARSEIATRPGPAAATSEACRAPPARKGDGEAAFRRSSPRPSRLPFLEAVADAVEGLDHFEIRLDHLELLPQPLDMAVDGAIIDVDLIVVSRVHESVAALDHPRPGR